MNGRLTFLGTGPRWGFRRWGAIARYAPRRTRATGGCGPRAAALAGAGNGAGLGSGRERVVVIDTGPDFREQALRNDLHRVDAVFYTHSHADHILGLDDLRPLSLRCFARGYDSALRIGGDHRGAGADLRLHFFSASHLSDRARVRLEPLGSGPRCTGWSFSACRSCMER